MNLHDQRRLESEYRLLERITELIEKRGSHGTTKKPSREQIKHWESLRLKVIKRIITIKDGAMKENLINLKYQCKVCGNSVSFSTNPIDGGAWMMMAPATQCLTGLNESAREMIAELKCSKCFKGE